MSALATHRFPVVVDKGTLDALCCGRGDPQESSAVRACLSEVARVLTPGGVYVVVSYGCVGKGGKCVCV